MSSGDQIGDTLKRSARILAIVGAALLCAAVGWFVWQSWQMVWVMESVTSEQPDPKEEALILKFVKASQPVPPRVKKKRDLTRMALSSP